MKDSKRELSFKVTHWVFVVVVVVVVILKIVFIYLRETESRRKIMSRGEG